MTQNKIDLCHFFNKTHAKLVIQYLYTVNFSSNLKIHILIAILLNPSINLHHHHKMDDMSSQGRLRTEIKKFWCWFPRCFCGNLIITSSWTNINTNLSFSTLKLKQKIHCCWLMFIVWEVFKIVSFNVGKGSKKTFKGNNYYF